MPRRQRFERGGRPLEIAGRQVIHQQAVDRADDQRRDALRLASQARPERGCQQFDPVLDRSFEVASVGLRILQREAMNLEEQRALLRQLVEKVGYDGRTGKVTVSFKSAGVKELVQKEAV